MSEFFHMDNGSECQVVMTMCILGHMGGFPFGMFHLVTEGS
jgi:hypothetical protein